LRCVVVFALLALRWKEVGVDVGDNTAFGDDDLAQKLTELLVVPDGELEMSGVDTAFLVIARGITGEFEDFSSEVFEDSSKVHWCPSTNPLCQVTPLQYTMDTTDGELETGLGRARCRL